MALQRPYRRTVRQFVDGSYSRGGRWMYVRHSRFAKEPEHYVRAFSIIQKDFVEILDYIEPDNVNLRCYSYRIHELFMRTCIEAEANFKAILLENDYKKPGNWKMTDYKKIEASHFLSLYEVEIPVWRGSAKRLFPFNNWINQGNPKWYQDYNTAKHNRHGDFSKASFENLVNSIAGLVALLSSQFWTEEFSPHSSAILDQGRGDGFDTAVGGYFRVKFPDNLPDAERYDFQWPNLENETDPFVNYPYTP